MRASAGAALVIVVGAVPQARGAASSRPDACALLSEAEVRAVQGQAVTQKVPSEQASKSFRIAQCLYRTRDHVHSVSLALTLPLGAGGVPSGARAYWRERFHAASPSRKKEPPRAVSGLGEEAFWVGDRLTGALYVLEGEAFLRLSVGGAGDEAARLQRSKTLAAGALKRLRRAPPK